MVLIMIVGLVGCGKSEEAKNVEAMIDAIGEVTKESEDAISGARESYDSLDDKEKEQVENNAILVDAESALQTLIEENAIVGTVYACTLVKITDESYEEFDVATSIYAKLFISTVLISEDRTQLVYINQMGEYRATLETEYDGEMWYESVVTWETAPTPYGDHNITATTLIFDEARGLVRMNFALDGEEGNSGSGTYFIFNEFEVM